MLISSNEKTSLENFSNANFCFSSVGINLLHQYKMDCLNDIALVLFVLFFESQFTSNPAKNTTIDTIVGMTIRASPSFIPQIVGEGACKVQDIDSILFLIESRADNVDSWF